MDYVLLTMSHDAAHPKRDLNFFSVAPMFSYQHLALLLSKVIPEMVDCKSIGNKQQEFIAVQVSQCKISSWFS